MRDDKGKARHAITEVQRVQTALLHSQEAILDLASFSVERGAELDNDNAIARRLARTDLPPVSDEVALAAYRAAQRWQSTLRQAGEVAVAKQQKFESRDDAAAFVDAFVEAGRPAIVDLYGELDRLGLDRDGFMSYLQKSANLTYRKQRTDMMLASLLIMSVSSLEAFIASLIREMARYSPETALKESEVTYSWADVTRHETMQAFREHAISMRVDSIMRGTWSDWLKFFQRTTRTSESNLKRAAEPLHEIRQRRHVLVHNDGRVSRAYMGATSGTSESRQLGEKLDVNISYLESAVDRVTIFCTYLSQLCIRSIADTAGEQNTKHTKIFSTDDTLLELLRMERYLCVSECVPLIIDLLPDDASRLTAKVNKWIADKALHGTEHIRAEVSAWDVSGSGDRYRLAKHALLDDDQRAYAIASRLIANGALRPDEYQTWPLLAGVREFQSTTVMNSGPPEIL